MDQQQFMAYVQQEIDNRVAAIRAAQTSPPKPPKPETFSASTPAADVELWIFQTERFFDAIGLVADAQKIELASTYLRGPALTWWRSIYEGDPAGRPATWPDFKEKLRAAFKPVNTAETARDRLATLKQMGPVRSYATLFRNTALEIPGITDDEKKDRFIRGLKFRTQEDVRMRAPDSFEQAVQLAERFDTLVHRNKFRDGGGPSRRPNYSSSYMGPADMELGAIFRPDHKRPQQRSNGNYKQLAKLTPELRQRLIKEGKCFFCREPGHMAQQCPRRQERSQPNRSQ